MTDNGDPAQESPAQWSYDQAHLSRAAGPDQSAGPEHRTDHGGAPIFGTSRTDAIPPIGAPDGETTADAAQYDPAQYNPAQNDRAQYNPAQNDPAQYDPAQYDAAQYDPAQYDPAQYAAPVYGFAPPDPSESGGSEFAGAAPEELGRHSQFGSDGFPEVHYYAHPGADPSLPVAPTESDVANGAHEPAGPPESSGPDELTGSVSGDQEQPAAVPAGSYPTAEFGSPFGLPPAAPFYADAGQHDQGQHAQGHNDQSQFGPGQYDPNQYDRTQYDRSQYDRSQYDPNQYDPNQYRYDQNQYAGDPYARDAYGRDLYPRDQHASSATAVPATQHAPTQHAPTQHAPDRGQDAAVANTTAPAHEAGLDPNSGQGQYPGQPGTPTAQQGHAQPAQPPSGQPQFGQPQSGQPQQPQPGQPRFGQPQSGQQQPGQPQPGQGQNNSQPSSYAPAAAPGAAKHRGPLPTAAQPRPESLLVPSHRATATHAAQYGWQGRVRRLTAGAIKPQPSVQELAERKDSQDIQRTFSRPMTIVVVQPKGGAGKTPATIALASALGAHRGGYVVGWDDNETRGTLAVRVDNADKQTTTVWDLLRDLGTFERTNARVGDLSHYVRSQGAAQFDALVSDDSPGNMAQIGESEFKRIHTVLQRFYRQIVVDTGNNVRSPNWQAAVNAADQIVVVSTYQRDVGYSGSWVLDHLIETGRAELAAGAITVLSAADPRPDPAVRRELIEHFGARTRAVVEIPYDPMIALGGPIEWVRLKPETRRAWTHAGASVVTALAAQDETERLATRTKS